MRIMEINAVPYGSTGRIMFDTADLLERRGHEVLCTSGFTWTRSDRADYFITSGLLEKSIHMLLAYWTGKIGCYSHHSTRRLLHRMETFQPDVIHLHNLHGWYINIPMLTAFIKKNNTPVIWTFHDCWPITGHCPHFTMSGCSRWLDGCGACSQYPFYPKTRKDHSQQMYRLKKSWFSDISNLTIAAPSSWMADQIHQSFLKGHRVCVIPNGIDLSVFHPVSSRIRAEYALENKRLVLGVAFAWDEKKGLDVFLELAGKLGDQYKIVLIGQISDPKEAEKHEILALGSVSDPHLLAEWYSAADVFVNPTREDTFPTVNMEAIACGTPVITFGVGGSGEMLDSDCGIVVPVNDTAAMLESIRFVCSEKPFSEQQCRNHALPFDFRHTLEAYAAKIEECHD